MPYQDELKEGQVVAIWAGDLATEDDVTGYLGQPFETDFGFLLDWEELPVVASAPMKGPGLSLRNPPLERVAVRALIDAISWSGDWAANAEQACSNQGMAAARLVMAFPHLRYPPDLNRNPNAPLRFIGNFPWPSGHDDWQERLKAQLICPPFPKLQRRAFGDGEMFSWRGRVHLGSWKGFATREDLADEFMTFRFSAEPEGDLTLELVPSDNRQRSCRPTHSQSRAFQHLLDHQQELRAAALDGVFAVYDDWREDYLSQDLPPENMPKLSTPSDLARLIAPSAIYILANDQDGFSQVGFSFRCKWDDEHGLGVLTHKGRVVAVGEADTAFTDQSNDEA